MDPRTHVIIAKKIYNALDPQKKSIIKKKNFIYGNIKPDLVSKYKLRKHYRKESYEVILEKIEKLSKINSLDEIQKKNIFVILVKNLGLFVILYVIFFVYRMMRDGNLNIACLFILLMKKN